MIAEHRRTSLLNWILASLTLAPLTVASLTVAAPHAARADDSFDSETQGLATVRLLVSPGQEFSGKTQIEALVIEPDIRKLEFYVDGEVLAVRRRPPWNVKVTLADPPQEQVLLVKAYDGNGLHGTDTVVLNRVDPPFRVHLTNLEKDLTAKSIKVRGEVSIPRKAELEKVEIFLNEQRVSMAMTRDFDLEIPWNEATPQDFVRAVAILADGRVVEDVELLAAPQGGLAEEIDVNLVQLQTLVVQKNGAPIQDLTVEDFEIQQGGRNQKIERLFVAEDVALVLGLVLDSSGSMRNIWGATQQAAEQFLTATMGRRDRSFVVNFAEEVKLIAPLSHDLDMLIESLGNIEPDGGTALYDAVLFSLLQFRDEPGRRALVVLTDGFDVLSSANPKRAVEFGRKLGVPVYIIALDDPRLRSARPAAVGGSGSAVQELKLLTEPTGGRLLRVSPNAEAIDRAFRQINHELRHQYVLTYYTEKLPDDKKELVKVRVPGQKGAEVRAVFGLDQIY
jgi:VWFA-related protein